MFNHRILCGQKAASGGRSASVFRPSRAAGEAGMLANLMKRHQDAGDGGEKSTEDYLSGEKGGSLCSPESAETRPRERRSRNLDSDFSN